jgi:hypothetical protein
MTSHAVKGSDIFIRALENEGVEYVFGVAGEENLDMLESLRTSRIKVVALAGRPWFGVTSALGQKQTMQQVGGMSALPGCLIGPNEGKTASRRPFFYGGILSLS